MRTNYLLYAIMVITLIVVAYLNRPVPTVQYHHTTYTDTIKTLELKYDTLYKIQRRTQIKYDTLYRVIFGDTSCQTTRDLLTMHRQLDTLGY